MHSVTCGRASGAHSVSCVLPLWTCAHGIHDAVCEPGSRADRSVSSLPSPLSWRAMSTTALAVLNQKELVSVDKNKCQMRFVKIPRRTVSRPAGTSRRADRALPNARAPVDRAGSGGTDYTVHYERPRACGQGLAQGGFWRDAGRTPARLWTGLWTDCGKPNPGVKKAAKKTKFPLDSKHGCFARFHAFGHVRLEVEPRVIGRQAAIPIEPLNGPGPAAPGSAACRGPRTGRTEARGRSSPRRHRSGSAPARAAAPPSGPDARSPPRASGDGTSWCRPGGSSRNSFCI